MKHSSRQLETMRQWVATNRSTLGTPRLFGLTTGMSEDAARTVLEALGREANPCVVMREGDVWGYNPDYRHHSPDPSLAVATAPA